jgi:CHAT domain-containing protein
MFPEPKLIQVKQRKTGRARPRIHWCPTGIFTFAPVHAAGIYEKRNQECLHDYAVSSYTPTVGALLRAQSRSQSLDVLTSSMSAIAVKQAQDPTLSILWKVEEEITEVLRSASQARMPVGGDARTASSAVAEVSGQFASAQFIHIACHGIQDPKAPLNSRFCMSDGSVSVEDLMNLDLENALFAFLSACETAKGDQNQPDQTIHLAATMMFVGFKSIVATLWYALLHCT